MRNFPKKLEWFWAFGSEVGEKNFFGDEVCWVLLAKKKKRSVLGPQPKQEKCVGSVWFIAWIEKK